MASARGGHEFSFGLFVAIKEIHRIKWNYAPIFVDDVHARFLDPADIEIVGIVKLHYNDPKQIRVA